LHQQHVLPRHGSRSMYGKHTKIRKLQFDEV
jgi:hypothetical protein